MLIIEYTPRGKAYSDFGVDQIASDIIDLHFKELKEDCDVTMTYRTSTDNLIDAIRLQLIERQIETNFIEFVCNGETMTVNKFGNPDHWAMGFCDITNKRIAKIVRGQMGLRVKEKEEREIDK
jgi:hypothetical protein